MNGRSIVLADRADALPSSRSGVVALPREAPDLCRSISPEQSMAYLGRATWTPPAFARTVIKKVHAGTRGAEVTATPAG